MAGLNADVPTFMSWPTHPAVALCQYDVGTVADLTRFARLIA